MIRICTSLQGFGYNVTLVGRRNAGAPLLQPQPFHQKRFFLLFKKGPFFYAEYNIRLLLYLLFKRYDCACAIDLDTIIPVNIAASLRRKKKVYDAHEYFSQQKEIISRPKIYKIWHWVEKIFVPKFKHGYTVSSSIAAEFERIYGVHYETVRNVPVLKKHAAPLSKEKNIFYQGAVNEARGFEFLIPAMKHVHSKLIIFGDGNFTEQAKKITADHHLQEKVLFKGKMLPQQLNEVTGEGYIGINLVENTGLNQYYSLANKFFDYIQHSVPQVTMNFPEYKSINDEYNIAVLIDDLSEEHIASALNKLIDDEALYMTLKANCAKAAAVLNWQQEEIKLRDFYKKILE